MGEADKPDDAVSPSLPSVTSTYFSWPAEQNTSLGFGDALCGAEAVRLQTHLPYSYILLLPGREP